MVSRLRPGDVLIGISGSGNSKNILNAVESVSRMLGNTPAICRKCYVHPAVLESFADGTMAKDLRLPQKNEKSAAPPASAADAGALTLSPEESAVLHYLEAR